MSRKLLISTILFSFILLGSAFSAVENIKVSGDLNLQAIVRDFSLESKTASDNDHEFLISQTRLNFEADLTEGVSAVLRFLSQETWGEDNADDLEVDLGYIQLKEFIYQPLTLIVGRQNLRYGNALIIGDPDTDQGAPNDPGIGLPQIAVDLSLKKSFDAARAILDFFPWTIDFIFAQLDEIDPAIFGGGTANPHDDEYLRGFNVNYDWGEITGQSQFGESELYFFNASSTPQSTSPNTKDYVNVVGLRTQANLSEKFTLGLEYGRQFGRYGAGGSERIVAFAGQLISEYRFLDDNKSKISLDFSYLSGDRQETSNVYEGWDPMFEDQVAAELMNGFLNITGRQFVGLTYSTMPRDDLTIGARYVYAWLSEKFTTAAIRSAMGPNAGILFTVNNSGYQLAHELDLNFTYDWTENMQVKAVAGWLIPGDAFIEPNQSLAYSIRTGLYVNF